MCYPKVVEKRGETTFFSDNDNSMKVGLIYQGNGVLTPLLNLTKTNLATFKLYYPKVVEKRGGTTFFSDNDNSMKVALIYQGNGVLTPLLNLTKSNLATFKLYIIFIIFSSDF